MGILPKIKAILKLILKKEYPFKVQVKIKKKWLGNRYGGFFVAPEFLDKNSIVYSVGIGEDISFDSDLINLTGCSVYGFDPTPKSINWISNQKLPDNFKFYSYGLDTNNGFVTFFLPENPNHISGTIVKKTDSKSEKISVPMKNITTITTELKHDHIDLLKIDIEGSEYSVIPDIIASKIKIKQILIEFHHRFFEDGFKKNTDIINMLNDAGYKIFAVSDSLMEVSFINSNLV